MQQRQIEPEHDHDSADLLFIDRLRHGDTDASRWLVQQHYAPIYRYLLYLTGRPETAEDLAQETFWRAWRSLETFEGRVPLQHWLYRIAHREFLQALRRRRHHLSLEQIREVPASQTRAWADAAELRTLIGNLPTQEREVIVLHYFEGYSYEEIAAIVEAPIGRIRHRLSEARARLRQNLGEGDLNYLNRPFIAALRRWAWLPLDELAELETSLSLHQPEARQIDSDQEAEVIDARLDRRISVAAKAIALGDLCRDLSADTDIRLLAAPSVADEKVTIFCREKPLRAVMRALSAPFGVTWHRSGRVNAYQYELGQDLHSQLLEEELRHRDRNAALLALDSEMQRYRKHLALSPTQAGAAAAIAAPEDRKVLENLAGPGWAAAQLYFRLTYAEMRALHDGQELTFSPDPTYGRQPLPQEVGQGILESFPDIRISKDRRGDLAFVTAPEGLSLLSFPGTQIKQVTLSLTTIEPGHVALEGGAVFTVHETGSDPKQGNVLCAVRRSVLAVGTSQSLQNPKNALAYYRLAGEPVLQRRVVLKPEPSCLSKCEEPGGTPEPKVTTSDVLEALHEATGLNIIGDYFTRLYRLDAVTIQDVPLVDALQHLSEAMRVRWHKEDDWLQFRSVSFFHDRLTEAPNSLLSRLAAVRRQKGGLSYEDLIEIACLSDAQLDAPATAEGARALYGLLEWNLARSHYLRPHWRFLGVLPPSVRRLVWSEEGLCLEQLSFDQQQQFLALAAHAYNLIRREQDLAYFALSDVRTRLGVGPIAWSLQDLAGSTLHLTCVSSEAVQELPPVSGMPPLKSALPGTDACVSQDITFIYRYGNARTGFWKHEVKSDGTAWDYVD